MLPNARSFLPSTEKKSKSLQEQLKIRFQDLHVMQPRTDLVADPLTAAVNEQPWELQLQLFSQTPFFRHVATREGLNFGNYYLGPVFPLLKEICTVNAKHVWQLTLIICESRFLTMKHIKSKERNRLTDDTLFQLLQVGCTNFQIDIDSVGHQQFLIFRLFDSGNVVWTER